MELITLSEFIEKIEKDYPNTMTKEEMQNIVFENYKRICKYNKFLNMPLTIEMFEGENKIFNGGRYNDLQPSTQWNYYSIYGLKIFEDRNGFKNGSIGKKVSDLSGKGLNVKVKY